jgi:hypothetical protein
MRELIVNFLVNRLRKVQLSLIILLLIPRLTYAGISLPINKSQIQPGDTLNFYFENGSPKLKSLFKNTTKFWSHHINLRFNFPLKKPSNLSVFIKSDQHIYVEFREKCISKIGGFAELPKKKRSKMVICANAEGYNNFIPTVGLMEVILHEMGHALGLHHEFLHPHSGISESDCREAYPAIGDRACIGSSTPYVTKYNPFSVMMYSALSSENYDREPFWPSLLSKGDIEIVQNLYGKNLRNTNSLTPKKLLILNKGVIDNFRIDFDLPVITQLMHSHFYILKNKNIFNEEEPIIFDFNRSSSIGRFCKKNLDLYRMDESKISEFEELSNNVLEYYGSYLSPSEYEYFEKNYVSSLLVNYYQCEEELTREDILHYFHSFLRSVKITSEDFR